MSGITITRTKILPPRRRDDLLSRERLLTLLDELLDRTLTLIVAPAGYGKTALLIDAARRIDRPVCWYTIDALDRDAKRFTAHLIAAIQEQFPEFGRQSMAVLEGSTSIDSQLDQLLTTLVNEAYDTIRRDFVLVLDDYHLVNGSKQINAFVNRFIMQVGENCHVVIASRSLLSLPDLPLLVARGQVGGLGLKELVFQPKEIQRFVLQNYQQTITESMAEELAAETEGWITGLLLSAKSIWKGLADRQRLVRVSGVDLYDYLAQQVLEQQPEAVQRFLLRSSPLEEFDAELCDLVLGPITDPDEHDWNKFLAYLSRNNLFVEPLGEDGSWLRYHQLFREFLETRLKETRLQERESILRRLGAVYLEREEWEKAHDAYRRLGDVNAIAEMIEVAGRPLVRGGRLKMLSEWIDALPTENIRSRPALLAVHGTATSMLGETERGLTLLSDAVELSRARKESRCLVQALVWRAFAHRFVGDYESLLNDANEALALTEQAVEAEMRSLHAEALRAKGGALSMRGRWNESAEWFRRSLAAYQALDERENVAMVRVGIGAMYVYTGRYTKAMTQYNRALAYWEQKSNVVWQANLLNNLGVLHHLVGDHERANELLERALSYAWQSGYTRMEALTLASIGDLYSELDGLDAALAAYQDARRSAERSKEHSLLVYLDLAEAALARRKHCFERARELLASAEARVAETGSASDRGLYCLEAGLLALSGDDPNVNSAVEFLKRAAQHFEAGGQYVEGCRAHLHLAQAFGTVDEARTAAAHLKEAFVLAANLDSWQPLVASGRQVRKTLQNFESDVAVGERVSRLLTLVEQFERRIPIVRRRMRRQAEAIPFEPPAIEIEALGKPYVQVAGEKVTGRDWQSQTARDLFFCLLAHPDGLTKETVGTFFWPDHSPKQLNTVFKKTVYRVRQAVGSDAICYDDGRYYFNRALDYDFDVESFEAAVAHAATAERRQEKIDAYRRAVALYRGPYLETLSGDWVWAERERLARTYKETVLELSELFLEANEPDTALEYCHGLLEEDPCYEEAHRLAMRIYAAMGDRPAVARQFERCRRLLKDHVDLRPSEQTEALYEVLTG